MRLREIRVVSKVFVLKTRSLYSFWPPYAAFKKHYAREIASRFQTKAKTKRDEILVSFLVSSVGLKDCLVVFMVGSCLSNFDLHRRHYFVQAWDPVSKLGRDGAKIRNPKVTEFCLRKQGYKWGGCGWLVPLNAMIPIRPFGTKRDALLIISWIA